MRFIWLVLLIISALEIGIFIWVGGMIGPWWVVILIILTGFLGIYLAKQQGIDTIRRAQASIHYGQMPSEEIFDGICIIIGGAFLITPGFVTDISGFILVLPMTRNLFKNQLKKILKRMIDNHTIIFRRW